MKGTTRVDPSTLDNVETDPKRRVDSNKSISLKEEGQAGGGDRGHSIQKGCGAVEAQESQGVPGDEEILAMLLEKVRARIHRNG